MTHKWFIGTPPRIPIPGAEGFSVHLGSAVHNTVVFFGYLDPSSPSGMDCRGTGFLVKYKNTGYLVTARHVAEKLGSDPFYVRANRRGKAELMPADNIQWTYHPDPLVDLAAIPLLLSQSHGFECTYFPEADFLTKDRLRDEGIDVGDLCYTVGLFHFIHGRDRNLPMVHSGNIALMPPEGERLPVDGGNGSTEWVEGYLIESRAIEGASGSPVVARSSITFGPIKTDAHGEVKTLWPEAKIGLLGVFQAAWSLPPDHPLRATVQAQVGDVVPVGLGVVVPSDKIVELLEDNALAEKRKGTPPIGAKKASRDPVKAIEPDSSHREDFKRLLSAAVKRPKSSD